MSTLTLTAQKPSSRHIRRDAMPRSSKHAIAEAWAGAPGIVNTTPKPSKRVIAETWAKLTGIVNTGETDLSTREGFGY